MAAHHLAAERTTFVGRAAELAQLGAWLADAQRLITVCGPGGAGKTRLLREAGRAQQARFSAGVWFCDLSLARSPEQLALAVALALELPLEAQANAEPRVQAWLAMRGEVLLLLDNCEQLEATARETLQRWLQGSPRARFLASSRESLGLPDERLFSLGPLTLADATTLFVDRGLVWDRRLADGASDHSVQAIVEQLERLPLAIELAAARLDVLSADELRLRLQRHLPASGPALPGGPARHSTLEATLTWSWELLSEPERRLLEDLSVFRGGFSLQAAAALCGDERQTLELLGSLRRKSLLTVTDGPLNESRYQLYEPVLAFADAQLQRAGRPTAAQRRTAQVICALTREWTAQFDRPGEPQALARLSAERENLLAVDDRFHQAEPALATAALLALHPLLLTQGPSDLHLPRLQRLVEPMLQAPADLWNARLLLCRGEVRRLRGQFDGARDDFERTLAWADDRHDDPLTAEALRQWALLEGARGRAPDALVRIRRALKLARSAREPLLEARCRGALGAAHQSLGRLRRAISAHSRALAGLRQFGSPRLVGIELSYLAVATHRLGHVGDAQGLHLEALALHRALGHRRFEAVELTHLGYVSHELGELSAGRSSYQAALQLFREVGDLELEGVALTFLGRLEVEAGSNDARQLLERALSVHRQSHHQRLESTTLALIGHLCRDKGDLAAAREHFARAIACSQAVEVGFETLLEGWLGEVERALGRSALAEPLLDRARACAVRHENPVYSLAIDLLSGQHPPPELVRAHCATSSELRRAMRLSGFALAAAPTQSALVVARDGAWLSRDGQPRVDLARRRAVRLVLLELTRARVEQPGQALTWESLLAIGWPGERPVTDSGLKRVYTAVWTLRTLGLEGLLVTRGDGYLLDTGAAVSWG